MNGPQIKSPELIQGGSNLFTSLTCPQPPFKHSPCRSFGNLKRDTSRKRHSAPTRRKSRRYACPLTGRFLLAVVSVPGPLIRISHSTPYRPSRHTSLARAIYAQCARADHLRILDSWTCRLRSVVARRRSICAGIWNQYRLSHAVGPRRNGKRTAHLWIEHHY